MIDHAVAPGTSDLLTEGVKLVFGVLGALLVPLAAMLGKQLFTRFGLQVSAEQDAKIRTFARAGIMMAEEYGAKAVKNAVPMSSSDKLDMAVMHLIEKVPGVDPQEAADLVHQELPKVRASLGGLMGSLQTAATTGPL